MSEQRYLEIYEQAKAEGDTETATRALEGLRAFRAQAPERTLGEKALGVAETGAALFTSALAEPVAGFSGMAGTAIGGPELGAKYVERQREQLPYQPRSEAGQEYLQATAETLQPVGEALQAAEQFTGDIGYRAAGPTGGAIGAAIPTAAMELTGLGLGKGSLNVAKRTPDPEAQAMIEAAEQADIPLMTSDLYAPDTKIGRFIQETGEMLGPLGTGSARKSQQKARQNAVTGMVEELDIDIDSPFAAQMVDSLNAKNKRVMSEAGDQRASAVESLNTFGEVPLNKSLSKIDDLLNEQARLGASANPEINNLLQTYKEALSNPVEPMNFELLKDIRTQLIRKGNAYSRDVDTSPSDTASYIKQAIDKDLVEFAKANDKQAAKDWLESNRKFAEEMEISKRTELKRIFNSGETTPEMLTNILKRGRPSELNRLYNSLDETGKVNAQKALLQEALTRSGYFDEGVDVNPDRFATAITKPNFQKAAKVFFRGNDKDILEGMQKVLNASRRAQEASTSVRTGEKLLLPAVAGAGGVATYTDPFTAIPATALTSALIKGYESKKFRNLMVRLKGSPAGSKREQAALDAVATAVVAELQAAKEQQKQE